MHPLSENLRKILERDSREGAQALLGALLVFGDLEAQIVETEAYEGSLDPGSHAHRGLRPKNREMFGPPGTSYIYFTYGNHWMLNVVGLPEGVPSAVLIRAAIPLKGLDLMRSRRLKAADDLGLLSGPGKLCQAFGLDKRHSAMDLLNGQGPLEIIPASRQVKRILTGVRIGLAPGKGDDLPWRYVDAEHIKWASRKI